MDQSARPWWEDVKEPVQINLNIPLPADAPKPKKVRKGCGIILGRILLRIIGLVIAVALCAYGGWICYQVPQNLGSISQIVQVVAQGGFLCLAGIFALIAETRTRWTMRGCINTYVIFANYLARGLFYCFLGALCFAIQYNPPYLNPTWLAGGILGGGGLNLLFYPFFWKYQRRRDIAKQQAAPRLAYPEEVIYGMNTEYIQNNAPVPVAQGPRITKLSQTDAAQEEPAPEGHAQAGQKSGPSVNDEVRVDVPLTVIRVPSGKGKAPELKKFSDEITIEPEPMGAGAC